MHTTSQYYRHIKQKLKNFFLKKKWSYTWSWFWVKLAVKKLSGRSHISFLTLDWIEAMEINIHQPLCAVLFYFYTFFAVVWCIGFVLISLVNDDGKHKEWDILFWLLLDFLSLSDSLVNISNPAVFVSSQCFLFPNIWEYWRRFIWLELLKIYFERKITKCCFIF